MMINDRLWRGLVGLAFALALGFVQAGCASSDDAPECEDNFQCDFGEICVSGVCQANSRGNNGGSPDGGLNNGGTNNGGTNNGGTNNGGTNNGGTNNGGGLDAGNNMTPDATNNMTPDATVVDASEPDVSDPTVCDPACGPGERCESGACVDDSAGGTCTRKNDPCDPNVPDQGSFWCVPTDQSGTIGECLPKCSETFSAAGCGVGEYCWNLGDSTQQVPACLPSQCQSNSECSSGTCILFDNQFGLCTGSGSTPNGSSCDPNAANTCQPGSFCVQEQTGLGVCRNLCDPWAPSTVCESSGQLCTLFTSRQGVCTPDVDAVGTAPFSECATPGNMCDNGVLCLSGGTTNRCIPFCRTGMGDCIGTSGGGFQEVCDNYVVAGERSYGICQPSCAGGQITCSAGSQCVNGVCRSTCTAGNEVTDCCNGDFDCDWTCVNGFCE